MMCSSYDWLLFLLNCLLCLPPRLGVLSLTACCFGGRHIVICPENLGVEKCACPERWCLVLQGQERLCNLLRIWVTVHQLSSVHLWSPVSDSTIVKMNIHFAITFTVLWFDMLLFVPKYCKLQEKYFYSHIQGPHQCIIALVLSWDDALSKVKTQKVYVPHVEEGEKSHQKSRLKQQ